MSDSGGEPPPFVTAHGDRVPVRCTYARINSLLDPPPSTKGQREIICRCWPVFGQIAMALIVKISVLLGPLPRAATKLEAFAQNSLVKDFLKAGWPEKAAFWDSISTRRSRLSFVQVPGAPPSYDGSDASKSPGDMIFKDLCKVKQEAAVNDLLYRSSWFSLGCGVAEKAVLTILAAKIRELAPRLGLQVEPPSGSPDEFWVTVRPRPLVQKELNQHAVCSPSSARPGLSVNDYLLEMVGGEPNDGGGHATVSALEGLRDRSGDVEFVPRRPPGTWAGQFSSYLDLQRGVERLTALASAAVKDGVERDGLRLFSYNALGEDGAGQFPPFVDQRKWATVSQEREVLLGDDVFYCRGLRRRFDRDWLGRSRNAHPFTSACLNYHFDVSLAPVGVLVNVDPWFHSRATSVSTSGIDHLSSDVQSLRRVLGKGVRSFQSRSVKDVEKLRDRFQKLAYEVNNCANSFDAEKRSRVDDLCVSPQGELLPFAIAARDLFVDSDDGVAVAVPSRVVSVPDVHERVGKRKRKGYRLVGV